MVNPYFIKINPCGRVRRLKNDRKKIEIIKVGEVQKLFPKNWKTIWQDKETAYIANRLASLTGMRAGEIMDCGENMFLMIISISAAVMGSTAIAPQKPKKPGLSR
jgi:hypothetical protein